MTYLDPDVVDDESQVAEFILGSLADQIADWAPSDGNPETAMGEAMAVVGATIAALIKTEERDSYAGFGTLVLGLTRDAATVATGVATWTLDANDAGVTIPAGTEVVWTAPLTGEPVAFATTGDVFVPAATLNVDVAVAAEEAGTDANGIVGDAIEWDALDVGVSVVTMGALTGGGAEEEAIEDYVSRVADRARRIRAIPVTADDFAAAALDVPGVARAVAINLLDPASPPAAGVAPSSVGHITVVPIDAAGQPVAGAALAALAATYTTDDRPLAVQVHIGTPTYTDVAVHVELRFTDDADQAAVVAAVEQAIADYLDPATWNLDENVGGRWRPVTNDLDRPVREYDIATIAGNVEGVAGVTLVTLNGADVVDLPGWAPLPNATTIDVVAAA